MIRRPPRSTRTDPPFPYTTLFRSAGRAAKAAGGEDKSYNAVRKVATRREPDYAQRHGLSAPVDVYPLYENATRAAWGDSLAKAQFESAEIWSRFSEVAAANPGAWIRRPASRSEEHTSELQSLMRISYAVFCLKKKK